MSSLRFFAFVHNIDVRETDFVKISKLRERLQSTIDGRQMAYRTTATLSSLGGPFDTRAGRIVLWVTHNAYLREHMLKVSRVKPPTKSS